MGVSFWGTRQKSVSCSNLQVEPNHVLAVPPFPAVPAAALAVEGTAVMWWHWLGRVGFTLCVPCAAEMEPGHPSALLALCQGCCAPSSSKLQISSLHSVFSSPCTGPMEMLQSKAPEGCRAPPNSGTLQSGSKRLFCLFFPSDRFADSFLWACPP